MFQIWRWIQMQFLGSDGLVRSGGVKFSGLNIDFVVPENPAGGYDPETGQVVIYTTDGQEAGRFDVPKNENGEAVFPVSVKDKDGKVYEVGKKEGEESVESSTGKPEKQAVEISEVVTSLGPKDSKVSFKVNNTVYGDGGKYTMLASAKIPDIQVITKDSVKADVYTYTFDGKKKINLALSQKDSTSYLKLSEHAENLKDGSKVTVTKDNKKVAELKIETYDAPVVKFDLGNNYTGSYFFDKGFDEQATLKNPLYYDTIQIKNSTYYIPVVGINVRTEANIKVNLKDFDNKINNDTTFRVVIKARRNGLIAFNNQSDSIVLNGNELNILKTNGLIIKSLQSVNGQRLTPTFIDIIIQSTRKIIGKLEYYSADMSPKKITLIYIKFKNESNFPNIIPNNLQTYLREQSLNQLFVKCSIDSIHATINLNRSYFTGNRASSNVIMRILQDSIFDKIGNKNSDDYYCITDLDITKPDGNKLGGAHYTGSMYGYSVKNNSMIGETDEEFIAHELGHWLNLPHTFEALNNIPIINSNNPASTGQRGATENNGDNFMDYNLRRKRWFKIQLINTQR